MIGPGGDDLREECGVVGVYAPARHAARIAFFCLHTLQHRGQEATGIASCDRGTAHLHRGPGLVGSVFNEDNLSTLAGESAIGHNPSSRRSARSSRSTSRGPTRTTAARSAMYPSTGRLRRRLRL